MRARFLTGIIGFAASLCLWGTVEGAEWGSLAGKVVLRGPVPEVALLVTKGDAAVKDPVCRGHDVPDDSLLIDAETQGIANVFVFLKRAPRSVHPELTASAEREVVFDQKGCRFLPHVMVVRTDQTVLVKSDDPTNHNTHTSPFFNTPENFLVSARAGPGESDVRHPSLDDRLLARGRSSLRSGDE